MLILITSGFPFGVGEQFLETEVQYLAARFPGMVVAPTSTEGEARQLPSDVELDTSLAEGLSRQSSRLPYLLELAHPAVLWQVAQRPWCLWHPLALLWITRDWFRARTVSAWLGATLHRRGAGGRRAVVYTYWFDSATLGAALFAKRHEQVCVVTRAHRGDVYLEARRVPVFPFRELTLNWLHTVYVVSQHGQNYLANQYPKWGERFRVARLGTRDPGMHNRASAGGVFRVASCSFLEPVKRVDLIVCALGQLAQTRPGNRFRWDHFGDGSERRQIEELARQRFGLNVSWHLHGQVANAQIYEFYKRNPVDVFVNASVSEGVPVSIMEALSFGIPVIAPAVGGIPEIVDNQVGAILPEGCSAVDLASALECLLAAPADHYRAAAKERWRTLCDASVNYPQFADQLAMLLDRAECLSGK